MGELPLWYYVNRVLIWHCYLAWLGDYEVGCVICSLFAYPVLQFFTVRLFRGAWRKAACVPLLAVVPVAFVILPIMGGAKGPSGVGFLFLGLAGMYLTGYLLALVIIRLVSSFIVWQMRD